MFVIKFMGGYANQLFQYAFLNKLRELFSSETIHIDISHYSQFDDHGGFKLGRMESFHYADSKEKVNYEYISENNYEHFLKNYQQGKHYFFEGYWQNEKYFPQKSDVIKGIFDGIKNHLMSDPKQSRNRAYFRSIESENSVSIHIRRGDYADNVLHGNISTRWYYQNAIDYILKELGNVVTFFVFSDDMEWVKSKLDFKTSKVVFVEGNEEKVEYDIFLMSQCRINIVSNSSFSWWAQYLNESDKKMVLIPPYWYNDEVTYFPLQVKNGIKISNVPYVEKKYEKPFFSILVPAYNVERYIRRCLCSVLNQEFGQLELIIVDDGSSDSTAQIVAEYMERDARIQLICHEQNEGLLATRITAVKYAKGEYILFLDSDDYFSENSLDLIYQHVRDKSLDVLEFGYIQEPDKAEILQREYRGNIATAMLKWEYPQTIWNKCYKKELIDSSYQKIQNGEVTYGEDVYQSVIIMDYVEKMGYCSDTLYHYVIGTGVSTEKEISTESLHRNVRHIKMVISLLEKYLQDDERKELITIVREKFVEYLHLQIQRCNNRNYQKMELYHILDEEFDKDYIDEMVRKEDEYDSFQSATLLRKIKKIVKYILYNWKENRV